MADFTNITALLFIVFNNSDTTKTCRHSVTRPTEKRGRSGGRNRGAAPK